MVVRTPLAATSGQAARWPPCSEQPLMAARLTVAGSREVMASCRASSGPWFETLMGPISARLGHGHGDGELFRLYLGHIWIDYVTVYSI